jgi:hypothetical protein
MDTNQQKGAAAQPAEEELKKHGDQLAKQVKNAAGQPSQDKDVKKREDNAED